VSAPAARTRGTALAVLVTVAVVLGLLAAMVVLRTTPGP